MERKAEGSGKNEREERDYKGLEIDFNKSRKTVLGLFFVLPISRGLAKM